MKHRKSVIYAVAALILIALDLIFQREPGDDFLVTAAYILAVMAFAEKPTDHDK